MDIFGTNGQFDDFSRRIKILLISLPQKLFGSGDITAFGRK